MRDTEAPNLETRPQLSATRWPLELSGDDLRHMVEIAMERVAAHLESLPEQPMSYSSGGEDLARSLREEALPEEATPFTELLDTVFDRALDKTYNTPSPGYLAYIPGGGLLHAAVADLIANAINRYVGVWVAAPGLVELEANVLRWFCQMVGYPEGSLGVLTSGGSLANFTAIVTARRNLLGDDFLQGSLYCSDQVHHSVTKAAMLAGFPANNIREVPSDGLQRIQIEALKSQIDGDRQAGFEPFLVVGSAGTVNTGAVDDFESLADVARERHLWLHVDGAYGGFFALTERGRRAMRGLEMADSITLDPHKGLFLPYGTGCLLVRDMKTLRKAHHLEAAYMPEMQQTPDLVDFCELSPELSRDFRGLRVWLPLKMHGVPVFREALDEKLDLATWVRDELRAIEHLTVVAEPQLSILAFRLEPPGLDPPAMDELNRKLLRRINDRQRVFLTATNLKGRFVIRICVLSFRTHLERMRQALEDIALSVNEVLSV
jgi:aromatic-L-amino-acid decarboxylase